MLAIFYILCYYIDGDYMKILFGTRNKNKVVEAKAIFLSVIPNVELVSLDEIDPNRTIEEPIEDGNSFYENSLIKAKYYFEKTNIPTICDDSGIVVDALNGAPGIHSARYAETPQARIDRVLNEMQGIKNRTACFKCCMTLLNPQGEVAFSFTGVCEGSIIKGQRGTNGFGYDPIFMIDEETSVAMISDEEKNKISHRAEAMRKLAEVLRANA